MIDKNALQNELNNVKRRIKLLMNFKNHGDTLGASKLDDAIELAGWVSKQKELIAKIKEL